MSLIVNMSNRLGLLGDFVFRSDLIGLAWCRLFTGGFGCAGAVRALALPHPIKKPRWMRRPQSEGKHHIQTVETGTITVLHSMLYAKAKTGIKAMAMLTRIKTD